MGHQNVEIKAKCSDPDRIRELLTTNGADHVGTDRQCDTYFQVRDGRLKLREGEIENALIFYRRPDRAGPKLSDVILHPAPEASSLKEALTAALGIDVVVAKRRDIYFIDNVKFHIDEVAELGSFVEIEAIDLENVIGEAELHRQCSTYLELLGVESDDLISVSYSDMMQVEIRSDEDSRVL